MLLGDPWGKKENGPLWPKRVAHFWKPCNLTPNGKSASDMLLGDPWGKKGKWATLAQKGGPFLETLQFNPKW